MIQSMFWGAVLRLLQAGIQATPTILVGCFVAAILRHLLGPEGTRKLFGCGTRRELAQAWLVGMLLPVCSLGVLPVAREMRRAGVSGGTVLAFAMTAPLFNPLSMLYGLTLSEPFVIFAFAFNALVVVTVVGGLWDRMFPGTAEPETAAPPVAYGVKRMLACFVAGADELVGPSLPYLVIGLGGVAALAAALPPSSLSTTMEHSNPYAPLAMAGVAVPAYATPIVAMSQLGSMFQHANSIGAAFVLLTFGAGLNLGLVAWMVRCYGLRRSSVWFAVLFAVVIGLAYLVENPLHPDKIEPAGHTHAFDMYCRPFDHGSGDAATVFAKIKEDFQPVERVGLAVLAAMAATGLGLRLFDRRGRVAAWIFAPPSEAAPATGWLNLTVPGPVLGGVCLLGLTALSVVGCYAYYPSKTEVFEEMHIFKGEVLTAALSGDVKHAEHFIPLWDDWTRRLQVGVFLREGRVDPYRRMKSKVFRDRLEFLKHAVEEGDREETREYVHKVDAAYRRMKTAYFATTSKS